MNASEKRTKFGNFKFGKSEKGNKLEIGKSATILKIVCQYNKFGFCRYGSRCYRPHVNEKCDNDNCNFNECPLRHPKKCRYFVEYNKCKFGEYCHFSHEYKFIKIEEHEKMKRLIYHLKEKLGKLTNWMMNLMTLNIRKLQTLLQHPVASITIQAIIHTDPPMFHHHLSCHPRRETHIKMCPLS